MVAEFRNSVFVSAGFGYRMAAALLLVYGIPLRVARIENQVAELWQKVAA